MKRGFEYLEHAYFEGWLGKLLVSAFFGLCFYAVIKMAIEPWAIDLLCRELLRCK